MTRSAALGLLLVAAILEVGGDALVRMGLAQQSSARWSLFACGALVLFVYGYTVNAPGWDFGRLLGIYVAFFFVVAQLMSWLVFHQPPSRLTIVGGGLIVAGGLVLSAAAN
jgi:drug/metabolite transporter superfamily protein YnfA